MIAKHRNERELPQSELQYGNAVAKGVPAIFALVTVKGIYWGSIVTVCLFGPSHTSILAALAKFLSFLP